MPGIEKPPSEIAEWIGEMYSRSVDPAAIQAHVEDLIKMMIRADGHDEGVEAVVEFLEAVGRDGPDQGMANREAVERFIRRLVDGALKLKKGAGE